MIIVWLMIAAPLVALFVFACYGVWYFGGYLFDRYDCWRANNWKGW